MAADTCHVSRGVTLTRDTWPVWTSITARYRSEYLLRVTILGSIKPPGRRAHTYYHGNQIIIGGDPAAAPSSQLVTLRWICVLYLQFDFQAMLPGPGLHPRAGGGGDEVSTQHYSHNTPLMSIRAVWLLASCGDVFQLKWGM